MEVLPEKPFQIVYSLYQHQYLGYLFESFVVQLDDHNKLTFQHQNISAANARDFASGLDDNDFELIKLMDETHQDRVVKKFSKKKMLPSQFFLAVYGGEKPDEGVQKLIFEYIEARRAKILKLVKGKLLFEMGNDGEPTHRTIRLQEEKATVLFHVMRNKRMTEAKEGTEKEAAKKEVWFTHYFPTIKYAGEKLEFQYKNAIIICHNPAYLLVNGRLFEFEGSVDGKKLQPFLNKKFIEIPEHIEDSYYRKFVAPLIESFEVNAKGLRVHTIKQEPRPVLTMHEMIGKGQIKTLFGQPADEPSTDPEKIVFSLKYDYGDFNLNSSTHKDATVEVQKKGEEYHFYKICRDKTYERDVEKVLRNTGASLHQGKFLMEKTRAFSWLDEHRPLLEQQNIDVRQEGEKKRYFLGNSTISIEIKEDRDWFDIHAIVRFGEFEIPFLQLRKLILAGRSEIKLPNGEVAVIPESWFARYADLFHFLDASNDQGRLEKHHFALVEELRTGNLAKVEISEKLKRLCDFGQIEEFDMPQNFKGKLRPYQKAGYNWLRFLSQYKLGGCLADDMGLGKTVQTLALLQNEKEASDSRSTSLLIMPTSLLYNWEMEAQKFTPRLQVMNYTGTNRHKNSHLFKYYDLVITSYGVARLDIDILKEFYFSYIILDESQVIKNPQSNIAQAVQDLKASHKLILTGTPIENSTLDLWSQMNFVNPGLLGTETFFKKEFMFPIEKGQDENRKSRLYSMIKPFILRRHKSQVATELPGKVEKVQYCDMTDEQEKLYEEVKSSFRNKILEHIEKDGLGKTQFILLQGLTQLRQLANHPKMVNAEYENGSGKMNDVLYSLENVLGEKHKVLIFSQFVKHLTIVRHHLDQRNIKYAYLDGGTKDRQAEVNKFQQDSKTQVFLISLKAGGVGLNLTAADYVFILDPWWNPAIEQQAIDRAHRIGQENKVFIYKFITRNSVEEKILTLQESKLKLANDLITTEDSFVKNLSRKDIESLLD